MWDPRVPDGGQAPQRTRRADLSHPPGRALFAAVKWVNIKDLWYQLRKAASQLYNALVPPLPGW